MKNLSPSTGWLSNLEDNSIYSYMALPGDKTKASWLIDEDNAIA